MIYKEKLKIGSLVRYNEGNWMVKILGQSRVTLQPVGQSIETDEATSVLYEKVSGIPFNDDWARTLKFTKETEGEYSLTPLFSDVSFQFKNIGSGYWKVSIGTIGSIMPLRDFIYIHELQDIVDPLLEVPLIIVE